MIPPLALPVAGVERIPGTPPVQYGDDWQALAVMVMSSARTPQGGGTPPRPLKRSTAARIIGPTSTFCPEIELYKYSLMLNLT